MSFSVQSLAPLSRETRYFSLFAYETEDPLDTVAAETYFAPAARILRRGDLLLVFAGAGSAPAIGVFIVADADGRTSTVRLAEFGGLDVVEAGGHRFRLVPVAGDTVPAAPRPRRAARGE